MGFGYMLSSCSWERLLLCVVMGCRLMQRAETMQLAEVSVKVVWLSCSCQSALCQ